MYLVRSKASVMDYLMFSVIWFPIIWCAWILTVGEKELEDLKIEREERDKLYRDECCRTANLMDKKGKHLMDASFFQIKTIFLTFSVFCLQMRW